MPFSTYLTQVRLTPTGTSFSVLQATVQAWHPMHLRLSITKPYFIRWKSRPQTVNHTWVGAGVKKLSLIRPLQELEKKIKKDGVSDLIVDIFNNSLQRSGERLAATGALQLTNALSQHVH